MTLVVGGGPGPLNQHNKFNTISNIHKRGAGSGLYGLGGGAFYPNLHRYTYGLLFIHPTILS